MENITLDGEIIESEVPVVSASLAVQLQKAEIDQLISTAHAFRRSITHVQKNILSMATLDEDSAEECMYALPRGGKPIRGPSIRFAEILKQAYGNCRAAARVIHVDRKEGYVEAEGIFHDLETNSASTARVRRRITNKNGKVVSEDMIIVTGNAACSIAMRNAILAGVPKPLWRKAYEYVQATIAGDITTLSESREKAFKALAVFGVNPEQIYKAIGIEGSADLTVDHITTLRGMYSALKNGEATVEEMFTGTVKSVSNHEKIDNPLSDKSIEEDKEKPDSSDNVLLESDDREDGGDTSTASDAALTSQKNEQPDPDDDREPLNEEEWLHEYANAVIELIHISDTTEEDILVQAKGFYDDRLSDQAKERAKKIVSYARQTVVGTIEPSDAEKIIRTVSGL